MKITAFLAIPLFFAASASLVAQQASPATKEGLPDPPLLGSAPAESQWTITYTLRTPERDAATPEEIHAREVRRFYNPLVLSKRILKSDGQMAIFTEYEAGMKTEAWVIGGIVYELPFRKGQIMMFDEQKRSDFSEIDWVKADNFRGTVELKGAKVHLYVSGDVTPPPDSAQPSAAGTKPSPPSGNGKVRRAYIDTKTRLPIMVDLGEKVLTYQYAGPAATFPIPDDRIKKVMQDTAASKRK